MKIIQDNSLKPIVLFLAVCGLFGTSVGQPFEDVQPDAVKAMKAGKWREARQVIVGALDRLGNRDLHRFGPEFGWMWYHRGYCEIELGMFEDAMSSFETCYKKFHDENPRNKKALLMWGHAAHGAGEWATSIRIYKKFLAERNPARDRYSKEKVNLNMAASHYMLRKIPEGDKHLEIIIHLKANSPFRNNEHAFLSKKRTAETPSPSSIEALLVLKGSVLEGLGKNHQAKDCYLKALELAEVNQNYLVARESSFKLIDSLGKEKNPSNPELLSHYDRFWKNIGNESSHNVRVAIHGFSAMSEAGRVDEALHHLQTAIGTVALRPGVQGLEEAINLYTDEYLKDHTLAQLRNHYFSLPGDDSRDKTTPALLRVAIIIAYERDLDSGIPERALHAKAVIEVLYKELRADFHPKDLPNLTLIKLADYLREQTPEPQVAKIYYEELLSRPINTSHQFPALLGLAKLKSKGNQSQKNQALKLLQRVIDDSAEQSEKEEAKRLANSIRPAITK